MIPKKIHFCWFSKEPYPDVIQKCMESWKNFLEGYEFVHWNAAKAAALNIPWVNEALAQKNWAFAADVVRLYALYTEGGIYLDSDVEVLKTFDSLLMRPYFFGYENGSKRIEAAVMGCEPGYKPIGEALDFYKKRLFKYSEENIDEIVLPNILAQTFSHYNDIEILPESTFSPKNYIDGKINANADTYSIHHFNSGWRPESLRKGILRRQKLFKTFPYPIAKILSYPLSLWTNLSTLGLRGTLRKISKKIH